MPSHEIEPAVERARSDERRTAVRARPRHHGLAERLGMTPEQFLVAAGIMAAIAVAALDSTVVGTAMPTIIGSLGGLSEYAWVFSAYLLVSTTTVPLYAKLADAHGRKPVFMVGLALFVGGSMLCGLSRTMDQLILFRALQGLGAGAVQPISFTIVGDVFETEQRARIQGLFSGVWGAAAIVGPLVGGLITKYAGWPWVFYINLPAGLLAAFLIGRFLHERFERRQHRLDLGGLAVLTLGIVLLLFAATEGGPLLGWTSPAFLGMLVASAALLVLFVWIERRVREPLIDLSLISVPVIGAGLAIGGLAGVVMFGFSTYVPPMIQGALGGDQLAAGVAVGSMSIGWPVGSIAGGRALLRFGGRPVVLAGAAMLVAGSAVVTQIATPGSLGPAMIVAVVGGALTGLGMGLSSTTILVVIQGAVAWERRAVATGLVQFSRTIGGAVGVGLLGGLLTAAVGGQSAAILDPIARASIPAAQLASERTALAGALGWIFVILLVDAALVLAVAFRAMPAVRIGGRKPGGSDAPPDA